jgi:Transmembrane family, TMEM144 of transporters
MEAQDAKDPVVGYIGALIAVLCFGTYAVPTKFFETGDGMMFQWVSAHYHITSHYTASHHSLHIFILVQKRFNALLFGLLVLWCRYTLFNYLVVSYVITVC